MVLLHTVVIGALLGLAAGQRAPIDGFRPPSVPLITSDPYVQIWSNNEILYGERTQYWYNGQYRTMGGIIRVDDDVYRFMGDNTFGLTGLDSTVNQMSVTVWPTRTIYQFVDPPGKVSLSVQFTTPALPRQWDVSSRPVTYITYTVTSVDAKQHSVQLYYDTTAEIAVYSTTAENVTWSRFEVTNVDQISTVMKIGTVAQTYFHYAGDNVGIDWGYAYVAVEKETAASTYMGALNASRSGFINNGKLPTSDDANHPRAASNNWPVLAVAWDLTVDASTSVEKFITFAYDDVYSIDYFGLSLQPYWKRPAMGATVDTMLMNAIADYKSLLEDCEQFDKQLVKDLEAKGGAKYATLAALAYRETTAATKLVWNDKLETPWVFFKDLDYGGRISPLNLIAPASPFFLYHDPAFLQSALLPILAYANNETGNTNYSYTFSYAPHDLGVYPVANILPSQQKAMPMEESANMLIMLAAVTQKLGVDTTNVWYPRYWPLLQSWADYLVSTLPDPPNQIGSDEFEAASPHDANLAVKGIVGVGAFAELCRILGFDSDHDYYSSLASSFAYQWVTLADDGDHYRRQYDLIETWSLKYNLLYDRLLDLGLFPPDVVSTELDYYLSYHFNTYGIPLDDRYTYTLLSWTAFVAAMSPSTSQRALIFETLYSWADTTPDLYPLPERYDTDTGRMTNYYARPTVGALYALMLV